MKKGEVGVGQGRSLWTVSPKWGGAQGQQRLAGPLKCGCVSKGKFMHTGQCGAQ